MSARRFIRPREEDGDTKQKEKKKEVVAKVYFDSRRHVELHEADTSRIGQQTPG